MFSSEHGSGVGSRSGEGKWLRFLSSVRLFWLLDPPGKAKTAVCFKTFHTQSSSEWLKRGVCVVMVVSYSPMKTFC